MSVLDLVDGVGAFSALFYQECLKNHNQQT